MEQYKRFFFVREACADSALASDWKRKCRKDEIVLDWKDIDHIIQQSIPLDVTKIVIELSSLPRDGFTKANYDLGFGNVWIESLCPTYMESFDHPDNSYVSLQEEAAEFLDDFCFESIGVQGLLYFRVTWKHPGISSKPRRRMAGKAL